MAKGEGQRKIPKTRIGRVTKMTNLGVGLATNLATAAGRVATGSGVEKAARKFHESAAKSLLDTFAQMKGLPMKAGQMISYIDDMLPPEMREVYSRELSKLQTKARPLRWKEIEEVIAKDLGKPPSVLFASFDEEPIAAASIGQVYRAVMKDGRQVAVKVQYPGVKEAVESDLKNIDLFWKSLSLVLPNVDVKQSLGDLAARVIEECDYGCELCSQAEFHHRFETDPEILVPATIDALCGEHVLTSEFVTGKSFEEMRESASAEEKNRYGRILFRFVYESLYQHGMFNADPHPGNYLFPEDGRVAFLDFGCVQRFDKEMLEGLNRVRRLAMAGEWGAPFREALISGYEIPADLDDEEWEFMVEYGKAIFAPFLEDKPFRYDRKYTEKLGDLSLKGGMLGARKALRKGVREAKRPGVLFLSRIQFGFASVLAQLDCEANWHAMMREIDEKIG